MIEIDQNANTNDEKLNRAVRRVKPEIVKIKGGKVILN
jgi:hypothetical protein